MPQFDLQDVHPFIGARRIDQVWVDAKHNVILSTGIPAGNFSGLRQYVVIAPTAAVGDSPLHLVKLSPAGAELQFSTQPSAGSAAPGFTAVELQDGQIVLHWAAGGVLQKAEQVDGPWTDVEDVTSPHAIPLTKLAEFFRIK